MLAYQASRGDLLKMRPPKDVVFEEEGGRAQVHRCRMQIGQSGVRSRERKEGMRLDNWEKGLGAWAVDFTLKESGKKIWMVFSREGS